MPLQSDHFLEISEINETGTGRIAICRASRKRADQAIRRASQKRAEQQSSGPPERKPRKQARGSRARQIAEPCGQGACFTSAGESQPAASRLRKGTPEALHRTRTQTRYAAAGERTAPGGRRRPPALARERSVATPCVCATCPGAPAILTLLKDCPAQRRKGVRTVWRLRKVSKWNEPAFRSCGMMVQNMALFPRPRVRPR